MVMILLHQDVEGKKRGMTVDVPATRADWLVAQGYASTAASKTVQHVNTTTVPLSSDPTNKANRELPSAPPLGFPGRVPFAAKPPFRAPVITEESYDPGKYTVAEVNAYLASVQPAEKARVLRSEKEKGQNRATIA